MSICETMRILHVTYFMYEELYNKYTNLVPQHSKSSTSDVKKQTEKLRNEILLQCRTVINYHVQNYINQLKKPKMQIDFNLNPKLSSIFLGISQISQNGSFLLSYLFKNPSIFGQIILKSFETPQFLQFVHQVLPAFFGYYSSHEQLDYAYNVYSQIIEVAPPNLIIELFYPLLNSVACFRFVEQTMTKFFDNFTDEFINVKESDVKKISVTYGCYLIDCIEKSLCLMPDQVLKLLRYFFLVVIKIEDFSNIFLKHFIFYQVQIWHHFFNIKAPSSIIMNIFNEITQMDTELHCLYNMIHQVKSCYSLPKFYSNYGITSPAVVFSIQEIVMAASLCDKFNYLPSSMTIQEFTSIDPSVHQNIIQCQFYPPDPVQKDDKIMEEHIIFEDNQEYLTNDKTDIENHQLKAKLHALETLYKDYSINKIFEHIETMKNGKEDLKEFAYMTYTNRLIENSSNFETVLSIKYKNKIIKDFSDCLSKYEEIIYCHYIQKRCSQPNVNIKEILPKIYSPGIRKHAVLSYTNKLIKDKFENEKMILNQLDQRFNDLFAKIPTNSNEKRSPFKAQVLKLCISLLQNIDKCSLVTAYYKMGKMIRALSIFDNDEILQKLFPSLIELAGEEHFLSTFILLNVSIMVDYDISMTFDNAELDYWRILEKIIYDSVKKDKSFLNAIHQTQDLLVTKLSGKSVH